MNRVIGIISFLFCVFACTSPITRRLESLEADLPSRPDSVLEVLDSMPSSYRRIPSVRAHWALLKSWALDKCYIDVNDDSLIRLASNYYSAFGPERKKMLAYYYLGRVQYNANDFASAIISMNSALNSAVQSGDYFYQGLSARALGDIYDTLWNSSESMKYYGRSFLAFDQGGYTRYADYSLLCLGESLNNLEDFDNAETVLRFILENRHPEDSAILVHAASSYISVLISKTPPDYNEAVSRYERLQGDSSFIPTAKLLSDIAVAYNAVGKEKQSAALLAQAGEVAKEDFERGQVLYNTFRIRQSQGRLQEALDALSKSLSYQNATVYSLLSDSYEKEVSEHYEEENSIIRKTLRKRAYTILSIMIFAAAVVLLLIGLYFRQKQLLNEYLARIAVVDESLSDMEERKAELSRQIASFLKNKYAVLDRIIKEYNISASNESQSRRDERLRMEIDNYLEDMRGNTETYKGLEKKVNAYKNDIMKKLREEVQMRPEEYRIMCYFYAGFSSGLENEIYQDNKCFRCPGQRRVNPGNVNLTHVRREILK